jgi:hypothetical protein
MGDMAVRNFWINTTVDGKKEPCATGPRSKDGSFETKIYIRDNGESKLALHIYGLALRDGTLKIVVSDNNSKQLYAVETVR